MKRLFVIFMSCICFAGCAGTVTEPASAVQNDVVSEETMMVPDHALRTPTGFAYVFLKRGSGMKPVQTDAVRMHIRVLNVEGTLQDEQSATLAVAHSTPFFEEMISVMDIGSVIRVWGESRDRIWDIEMLGVDESYRCPEDVAQAPDAAETLSGFDSVRWRMIEPGHGSNANTGQTIRVQATRWKSSGEILESNRAGRGMVVFLNEESQQLDPMHDALLHQLNEGAHARIWIPAEVTGAGYDMVEDMWVVEFLTQLDKPEHLHVPETGIITVSDGAWMKFEVQADGEKLADSEAVEVDMTCWNGSTGALIDATYFREKRDIMEIKPELGIWQDIMKNAAPGDRFQAWINASALPEQVNMDLTCRVSVFDRVE